MTAGMHLPEGTSQRSPPGVHPMLLFVLGHARSITPRGRAAYLLNGVSLLFGGSELLRTPYSRS